MTAEMRANYALLDVLEHLGDDADNLDVPWASFVGNQSSAVEFEVPTADATAPYFGLQAFDVGTYGHEVLINGNPVSGFDLPPAAGWQYWVDAVTDVDLTEGTNTFQVVRDASTQDDFVIGTVVVHWKEPVD